MNEHVVYLRRRRNTTIYCLIFKEYFFKVLFPNLMRVYLHSHFIVLWENFYILFQSAILLTRHKTRTSFLLMMQFAIAQLLMSIKWTLQNVTSWFSTTRISLTVILHWGTWLLFLNLLFTLNMIFELYVKR